MELFADVGLKMSKAHEATARVRFRIALYLSIFRLCQALLRYFPGRTQGQPMMVAVQSTSSNTNESERSHIPLLYSSIHLENPSITRNASVQDPEAYLRCCYAASSVAEQAHCNSLPNEFLVQVFSTLEQGDMWKVWATSRWWLRVFHIRATSRFNSDTELPGGPVSPFYRRACQYPSPLNSIFHKTNCTLALSNSFFQSISTSCARKYALKHSAAYVWSAYQTLETQFEKPSH